MSANVYRGLLGAGLAVPAVVLVWRSWALSFLVDDAYISFRYARNLLEGHGLVFNRGEYVEGYTNFLWVLEVAALWAFGIEPATASLLLSWLCTVALFALVAWWAWREASPSTTAVATVLAAWLWCTDRNVALWTTSGLEQRQFTLLASLGMVLVGVSGVRAAAATSLAYALAALTRPEGLLYFVIGAGLRLMDGYRRGTLDRAEAGALLAPFVAIVGAHQAFRVAYYGAWVPNTYVAKHVRPWVDMGLRYLGAVTIESALYLVVPLALAGWVGVAWRTGRLGPLVGPLSVAAHAVFVVRVGGDHFHFRPLDAWWPTLFVGAALGIVALARRLGHLAWTAPLALGVIVWGSVLEVAHDRQVQDALSRGEHPGRHPALAEVKWLRAFPPQSWLAPRYDALFEKLLAHLVAVHHFRHRAYAEERLAAFAPLEPYREAIAMPGDAVGKLSAVGISAFYLPDLTVIDTKGLTDATIARAPTSGPNRIRHMAHDREPPPGYLASRGHNLTTRYPVRSRREALEQARYALVIAEDLYLPFRTPDPEWARARFGDRMIARKKASAP